MFFVNLKRFFLLAFFMVAFCCPGAWALDFGQNKVRYHTDLHWKIIETEHFQVYYHDPCMELAQTAADMAEKDFVSTSQAFEYVPKTKIPLFIYPTPLEFEETNITPEILSEGVGGFTEVFKNRIAVPMDGSYHEFEKVIHHELTHAFQYDLIYGEGWRSVNLFKAVFVPEWMMEGMAEWNAQHLDGQGEMVLRDAVLNDQTVPLRLMESFDHFPQVYTAYKESQSILDYVTQVYGQGKVPQLFKHMALNQPPDTAVKAVLGISLDELYDHWLFFMKSQAWSRINGMAAPDHYGEKAEPEVSKAAVSPDGTQVALLKRGGLFLWDPSTKKKQTLLNRPFNTSGSGIAWSPDGKFLAFSFSRDGEYGLYTLEVKTRKLQELKLSMKLPVIYSPAWSPDGKYLVFSAFDYQEDDLYRYELATGGLTQLTKDHTSKSWAAYGPDQSSLYYIDEDQGETCILAATLNSEGIPEGTPAVLEKAPGTLSCLRVGKDDLWFGSNRGAAIFNLYRMGPDGNNLIQLTNSYADVLNAAPSPDGSHFYAVVYEKSTEELYAFQSERLEKTAGPPPVPGYLGNSFADASKILPINTVPKDATVEIPREAELPPGLEREEMDKDEPEVIQDRKPPVKPPATVTHLEATEASNLVQIQWPVSTSDEDWVENYRVYRAAAAGATFIYLGSAGSGRQGSYVDYDVQNGGTYFYYVTAVNKAGESDPSPTVEVHPAFKLAYEDAPFTLTPDILLFLAGYDSSFGFVGGGVAELSDEMGDHRIGILGDTIPGVRTGIEANYEFSQWRTTVDFDYFYYQNYFNIYDLQTGNIVNEYRNNENGFTLNFSYPIDQTTRVEYGIGTQRFLGSPIYLQFSEGISNYNLNSDQWNVANFYRLSFVQDKRKGTAFWPSSGYGLNFTLLHALPVLDYNVSFANLLFETDTYADLGFLNHLIWANRLIGMTSQGPNPQTFFIADDAPFEAYFTTIRGYGGSTFYGSNLVLDNTELRYPLATNANFILQPLSFLMIKDIELAGFMDVGAVSNSFTGLPDSPVLASVGTGLRFYTFLYQRALVMFRFDVAWRLDASVPPTFHFNLAPMF